MAVELHPDLERSEFTLDDLVFPPTRIPDFEAHEVDLTTNLTRRITLGKPLISSPMDTVTGSQMAILMALHGGIGVIHYNFPTIDSQMEEVIKVRRFKAGFVRDPVVLSQTANVCDVYKAAKLNGFFSFPITIDGTRETPMVGMVTRRDVRHEEEDSMKMVCEVMTPRDALIVADRRTTLDCNDTGPALKIFKDKHLDTVPIVDDNFHIVALVTDSDIIKDKKYPQATQDENKQLKVLVAVESRFDKTTKERIMAAKYAGASGIIPDARNIYASHLEIARYVKKNAPELDVILGNVVTAKVVDQVMTEAGQFVDGFRVGIGSGELCISTETLGIGRALGSALYEVSGAIKKYENKYGPIGLIADGGIKFIPRHIIGILMLGAGVAMMGSELGGLEESPVAATFDSEKRQRVKRVRGMGSEGAITDRQGGQRYGVDQSASVNRYAEGISKTIAYKGPGLENLQKLFAGVRQGMQGLGFRNIAELQKYGYIVPANKAISKGTL